jgi:hypothetical protein
VTLVPAASRRRAVALLVVALLALAAAACRRPDPDAVRFAVFTDAHVFDEKARDVTEILRHSAADRDALRWAVATIDRQPDLDFVVYTGDWGLENVDFAGSGCDVQPVALRGDRLQPFPWSSAVAEVAAALAELRSRRLLMLPGNNDRVEERATDLGRYTCFVARLGRALAAAGSPLEVVALDPAGVVVKGVRFAGLDSASFKSARNYLDTGGLDTGGLDAGGADVCARPDPPAPCPAVQLEALARGPRPLVLFTHVPDLVDPQAKAEDPSLRASAWHALDGPERARWVSLACGPDLLAIFAGHFHSAERAYYGTTSGTRELAATGARCVQRKTRVAPPLAVKYQDGVTPGARGLLLATVTARGVASATVEWLPWPGGGRRR